MLWTALAGKSLEGLVLSRLEGLKVLRASQNETIHLVAAAYQVRRRYFGNRVRLN